MASNRYALTFTFNDGSAQSVEFEVPPGEPGYTPKKGVDYFDGEKGEPGPKGDHGEKGEPGHTPVRGVDYWTEEDKASIVAGIDCASPIVSEKSGNVVAVNDSSDGLLKGLTLYGKTTQAGAPTPENPVELVSAGASGAINTTVCGKNLFNDIEWFESNGFTKQSDGSWFRSQLNKVCFTNTTKKSGSIYLAFTGKTDSTTHPMYFLVYYTDGTYIGSISVKQSSDFVMCKSTTDPNKTVDYIKWTYGGGGTYYIKDVMISFIGSDYEPYKAQTATFSTPNGLPGIPVSSGGNYTDENGQRWICDEIDFARGVYVKKTATVAIGELDWTYREQYGLFTSTPLSLVSTIHANGLCTHYPVVKKAYSKLADKELVIKDTGFSSHNYVYVKDSSYTDGATFKAAMSGAKLVYELAEPIETPLSAEEMAQYSALRTYYPNTTVYNDAGAGLKLGYTADTKTYIDNKFTELQNAILSAGANI